MGAVRALLFDVFGTCVDWRTGVARELESYGLPPELAVEWRGQYQPELDTVRSGARPWVNLDVLHRVGLNRILEGYDVPEASRRQLVQAWHKLDPWPDVVEGLTRLKERFIIAPCSNGHIALQVALARRGGLPWDAIVGAELARAYKPDPEVYQRSVQALGLELSEAAMVAAHNDDLAAAAALGMSTIFVARPGEDPDPTGDHDVVAWDFIELAETL